MIVIIPCGARKLTHKAMAKDIYIGSYAVMCKRYARSLVDDKFIFILSAKYGLLKMTDKIEPYSLTLGQAGAITLKQVREQVIAFGILEEDCIAIGGKRYTDLCRAIWQNCKTPLQDNIKGGNGMQLQWMKQQIIDKAVVSLSPTV